MLRDEELQQKIENSRMTPEDFERLPESVKADIRKKQAEAEARAENYKQRLALRTRNAIILSSLASGVVAMMTPGGWIYAVLLMITSGVQGYWVVKYKLAHYGAVPLYGFSAVLVSMVAFGGVTPSGFMGVLGSWIFQIIIGIFISRMVESERSREDIGF